MSFEKGFMTGAATAAHQVEGNNTHSDYWLQEQMPHSSFTEPSGIACDHYNRYEEDIKMLAKAGLNAYRFSIEWARIEPEEGHFDVVELDHYRKVIRCCRENGVEPVVTLMHFTSPAWLIRKGGWEADTTPADFETYVRYVCAHLQKENLKYMCTINEANLGTLIAGYIEKAKGAQKAGQLQIGMDLDAMLKEQQAKEAECMQVFGVKEANVFASPRTKHGNEIICKAHHLAVQAIHELLPGTMAGMTLSISDIQSVPGGEENAKKELERIFMPFLPAIEEGDFFGIQSYTRNVFGPDGEILPSADTEVTQMKYEYYPQGIGQIITTLSKYYHGPFLITENGIATDNDARRIAFIKDALKSVQKCMKQGIDVRGYLYWSLIDNWEWQSGYSMQFGLMDLDRKNQIHTPRKSMGFLGSYTKR